MYLSVEFDLDNAAFGPDSVDRGDEAGRILRKVAADLESGRSTPFPCIDVNGNIVGHVDILEDSENE